VTGGPEFDLGSAVPPTELVDADQVAVRDRVVALALQMPHTVTARVVDGATVRLSFASVTVRLGRTTPVRRVHQPPDTRATLDLERGLADALTGAVGAELAGRYNGSIIFTGAGRDDEETAYGCVEGSIAGPDGAVLRGPDGRLYDVRLAVDVTARPLAAPGEDV